MALGERCQHTTHAFHAPSSSWASLNFSQRLLSPHFCAILLHNPPSFAVMWSATTPSGDHRETYIHATCWGVQAYVVMVMVQELYWKEMLTSAGETMVMSSLHLRSLAGLGFACKCCSTHAHAQTYTGTYIVECVRVRVISDVWHVCLVPPNHPWTPCSYASPEHGVPFVLMFSVWLCV